MARVITVWCPLEDGEIIIGTYKGMAKEYHVLTDCQDEDGKKYKYVAVHDAAMLREPLTQMFFVGDEIAIGFGGKKRSKNGYDYNVYTVALANDPT